MWTSPLCSLLFHNVITPRGTPSSPSIQPFRVQKASMLTRARLVGVGSPSKYFDFPVASLGTSATVALKRARRARPQQMKQVRMTVSNHVCRPTANASTAGATQKEIYGCYSVSVLRAETNGKLKRTRSARLSSSCPSKLALFLHLATLPSRKSKNRPPKGNKRADQR